MNNKGFAVSGILYTLLLIFITILVMLLFNFQNKKNILDKIKQDTLNKINGQVIDASELLFDPDDPEWKVTTVKEALDYFNQN